MNATKSDEYKSNESNKACLDWGDGGSTLLSLRPLQSKQTLDELIW